MEQKLRYEPADGLPLVVEGAEHGDEQLPEAGVAHKDDRFLRLVVANQLTGSGSAALRLVPRMKDADIYVVACRVQEATVDHSGCRLEKGVVSCLQKSLDGLNHL